MEPKKGNVKVVVIVIVVLAVIAIAYFVMKNKAVAPADNTAAVGTNNQANQVAQAPLDTSDASIDKDTANVDASLKALDAETVSVDQSINDKPVDQIQL